MPDVDEVNRKNRINFFCQSCRSCNKHLLLLHFTTAYVDAFFWYHLFFSSTVPLAPTNARAEATAVRTVISWIAPNETEIGMTIEYQIGANRSVDSCNTFSVLGPQNGCAETVRYLDVKVVFYPLRADLINFSLQ